MGAARHPQALCGSPAAVLRRSEIPDGELNLTAGTTQPPLTEPELRSPRELGRRWQQAVPEAPPPLPVYPSLRRTSHIPRLSRFTRFAPVSLFQAEESGEASLRAPVLALHVSTEDSDAQRFRQAWDQWGAHVLLEVVSPYRAVAGPIVNYIEVPHAQRPDLMLTVVLPVIKVRRPWQRPLDSRLGEQLRRALERHRGIAVMAVPFHLPA